MHAEERPGCLPWIERRYAPAGQPGHHIVAKIAFGQVTEHDHHVRWRSIGGIGMTLCPVSQAGPHGKWGHTVADFDPSVVNE